MSTWKTIAALASHPTCSEGHAYECRACGNEDDCDCAAGIVCAVCGVEELPEGHDAPKLCACSAAVDWFEDACDECFADAQAEDADEQADRAEVYGDDDGIDGPWERAMDRAIKADRERARYRRYLVKLPGGCFTEVKATSAANAVKRAGGGRVVRSEPFVQETPARAIR